MADTSSHNFEGIYSAVARRHFACKGISVNARQLLLIAIVSGCAVPVCEAQSPCNSTSSTLPLVCELPFSASAVPSGGAAAQGPVQGISSAINASIATQLTQLPVPSATSGTVRILAKDNPAGVPYSNLGPILTDRPETVGRNHLYAGFSYQHFNFNTIDGFPLGNVPFAYTFTATSGATAFGTQTSQIGFKFDQYVAQATYGAGRLTDISVVLPINSVYVNVTNTKINSYIPSGSSYLTAGGADVVVSGSASGVGDLQIGVKQQIHGGDGSPLAASLGVTVRFPTGDYKNYLGSGAYGANINGILSYRSKSRVSPHLRLGYQYNGPSPLVNNLGDGDKRLPGGLQYNVGSDVRVLRPLTFAIDVLGSEFANTTSLQASTVTLSNPVPAANSGVPASLSTVTSFNNTYTTVNLSTGFKYSPVPHLLFYGNVLLSLKNVGIRSDPVPLGGIAYNFGRTK